MSGTVDDGRHDEMARRLTAGLHDAGLDGEVTVDVEAIARVGAFKVRRRRNVTAAGVAAGVVVLVVGGTIIARQPPTTVRSAGSGPVPVCVSSTTTPTLSEVWDGTSPADEGSPAESTINSPAMTVVAGPSDVRSAMSAAESRAVSEASSAKSAAEAAARSAALAAAGTSAAVPTTDPPLSVRIASPTATVATSTSSGLITATMPMPITIAGGEPAWYSQPKRFQLTAALRAAVPPAVEVLKGTTNWLEFSEGLWFGSTLSFVVVGTGPSASGSASQVTVSYEVPVADGSGPTGASASGAVFKPGIGWGTLTVGVSAGKKGAPTCSDGAIQRRITQGDGTVVDVGVINRLADTGAQPGSDEASLRVTAYRPDGTIVTAEATTTGTAKQLPMTADELVTVATAPGLDVTTAPNAADSSSAALLTTDQNGMESTLKAPASTLKAPASTPAPSAQVSPTR